MAIAIEHGLVTPTQSNLPFKGLGRLFFDWVPNLPYYFSAGCIAICCISLYLSKAHWLTKRYHRKLLEVTSKISEAD